MTANRNRPKRPNSITAGWGGPQAMTGPVLVIPYRATATETVVENGQSVTRTNQVTRELTLAPETIELSTRCPPEVRKRSIYEAVVYDAQVEGKARFAFPPDLGRTGVEPSQMDLARAELRFGLSDPRGLGANPSVAVGGRPLRLQPGGGSSGGRGFFAWVDATALQRSRSSSITTTASAAMPRSASPRRPATRAGRCTRPGRARASAAISCRPSARSPTRASTRPIKSAIWRLAGHWSAPAIPAARQARRRPPATAQANRGSLQTAQINLIQPVDLYSQVNRATKYGFLFIGFTFLALLMFDVIGGVRVSAVEYLLMGAALVLFFVLLLAFAEVIGFTLAYVLASAAIAGLNTAYSAAVLGSWRRAAYIGALLVALYAVLYILLSLEAFSLLIGSLLLFAALAGVMYATRTSTGAPNGKKRKQRDDVIVCR